MTELKKKTVKFDGTKPVAIINYLGKDKALLFPLNHPDSENVSNTKEVVTSAVISFTMEGDNYTQIETQNTIYVNSEFLT